MKDQNYATSKTTEIRLARRSPEYWRVTFDYPPLQRIAWEISLDSFGAEHL